MAMAEAIWTHSYNSFKLEFLNIQICTIITMQAWSVNISMLRPPNMEEILGYFPYNARHGFFLSYVLKGILYACKVANKHIDIHMFIIWFIPLIIIKH